jgi:hypothetical protein
MRVTEDELREGAKKGGDGGVVPINDTVGVVIGGVNAPLVASMRVGDILDSIGDLVPHVGIR